MTRARGLTAALLAALACCLGLTAPAGAAAPARAASRGGPAFSLVVHWNGTAWSVVS